MPKRLFICYSFIYTIVSDMKRGHLVGIIVVIGLLGTGIFLKNRTKNKNVLLQEIKMIVSGHQAVVGVSVIDEEGNRVVGLNEARPFPLLSVFKLPCVSIVLDKLRREQISLDKKLILEKQDLIPETYSLLSELYPQGMTVADLMRYSLSQSDNNACDLLIRFVGGIDSVQDRLEQIGFGRIRIEVTEKQMYDNLRLQRMNVAAPLDMVCFLRKIVSGAILPPEHAAFVRQSLIEIRTGQNKLCGKLPRRAVVGHKTGSSDRNTEGLKIADNDLGFVVLPNGHYYYIAVFVSDSYETDEVNASIISSISSLVYNYMCEEK